MPTLGALVVDESHTGCGLIVRKCDCEPKVGDVIVVRLGKLGPLRAEVAWLVELDAEVLRVGVNFVPEAEGGAANA